MEGLKQAVAQMEMDVAHLERLLHRVVREKETPELEEPRPIRIQDADEDMFRY